MSNKRKDIENKLNGILFSGLEMVSSNLILRIFKELLQSIPISKKRYYGLTGVSKAKADTMLDKLGEVDEKGNIVAFSGLSIVPTDHRFEINGKTLYTWCAVDAILFAEWLDIDAKVTSTDPIDGTSIELQINGGRLIASRPYPIYISWLEPKNTYNIRGSFCKHVSFFASETTTKQWLDSNLYGKILTLDDFYGTSGTGMKCC